MKRITLRIEHGVRGAGEVSPLQAGVVVHAHSGDAGDLVAAQARDAATTAARLDAGLRRGDPAAARRQEFAYLGLVIHVRHRTVGYRTAKRFCQNPSSGSARMRACFC
jgi:hypothetical protein